MVSFQKKTPTNFSGQCSAITFYWRNTTHENCSQLGLWIIQSKGVTKFEKKKLLLIFSFFLIYLHGKIALGVSEETIKYVACFLHCFGATRWKHNIDIIPRHTIIHNGKPVSKQSSTLIRHIHVETCFWLPDEFTLLLAPFCSPPILSHHHWE